MLPMGSQPMGFGQYAHLTYGQVLRRHPDYLDWAEDQPGLSGPLADWVEWCHGQEPASVEHSDGSEDSEDDDDSDDRPPRWATHPHEYYENGWDNSDNSDSEDSIVVEDDSEDEDDEEDSEDEQSSEDEQKSEDEEGSEADSEGTVDVEIVGTRSREEKDAALRAEAIDLEAQPDATAEAEAKVVKTEVRTAARRRGVEPAQQDTSNKRVKRELAFE
mmetsp:Transcript_50180/g.166177  ORF Transcript_50180/g.166177 Transcript_50180/m.166177 type:complete len:217 (+) Transcript_50180:44-694(+)